MANTNDNSPENDVESGLQGAENLNRTQMDLLKKLAAIGSDLWGGMPSAAYQKEETPDRPAAGKQDQPAPKKKKETPAESGIRSLWKMADETVDWTDALAHELPTDGLTGKRLWAFYHKMADKVLSGDLDAYTEVLKTSNPLGELTGYANGINMRAPSPERLESTFVCKDEAMNENRKLYLAAMGLRIARDLLACLPVNEVKVTAEHDGKEVFSVTYPRHRLLHQNFAFIDPIRLAEDLGAVFK
jgi:hypothetical protein